MAKPLRGFTVNNGTVKAEIHLDHINGNLTRAQYALDNQVMTDMVPLMPHNTGAFVNLTRAVSSAEAGSGLVCAAAPPMGRFLYEGKVMVDPETGSPWARKGAKKVVTDRPLKYSNPKAVPHWFEVAKDEHLKEWIKVVEDNV